MRTVIAWHLLKINESQYIALFVVSGSIKKTFSVDCVNIYFSQSAVSYLFLIDLKVWGYPTLLISWFINFKYFYSFLAAELIILPVRTKFLFRNFHIEFSETDYGL